MSTHLAIPIEQPHYASYLIPALRASVTQEMPPDPRAISPIYHLRDFISNHRKTLFTDYCRTPTSTTKKALNMALPHSIFMIAQEESCLSLRVIHCCDHEKPGDSDHGTRTMSPAKIISHSASVYRSPPRPPLRSRQYGEFFFFAVLLIAILTPFRGLRHTVSL